MVTLPLEHVRGRYAFGMLSQMGLGVKLSSTDERSSISLVARNIDSYVDTVLQLVRDDALWRMTIDKVKHGYDEALHQNNAVAREWASFFRRIYSAFFV